MFRRWRAAWPKRTKRFDPPWPQGSQAAPTPKLTRQPGWRPRLAPLPRRGRFAQPPWPQGSQANPVPAVTYQAGSRPRFAPKLRRARYHEPPWPQGSTATPTPAIHHPAGPRPLRFPALPRRGHYFEPPWPQGQLGANLPQHSRARIRPLPATRRGTFLPLPPSLPAGWVPPCLVTRRLQPTLARHPGRHAAAPPLYIPPGPAFPLRLTAARTVEQWSATEGPEQWSAAVLERWSAREGDDG